MKSVHIKLIHFFNYFCRFSTFIKVAFCVVFLVSSKIALWLLTFSVHLDRKPTFIHVRDNVPDFTKALTSRIFLGSNQSRTAFYKRPYDKVVHNFSLMEFILNENNNIKTFIYNYFNTHYSFLINSHLNRNWLFCD